MNHGPELNKRDIEFLYEVGCLRFIPRAWKQLLGPNFANLAEHTLRVMWTATLIAKHEKADVDKVIKIALVHDVPESRTGDVHYISRLYTKRDEEGALSEIFKEVNLADEFLELWKEYEKRGSLEAKIVKDADNLDVDFELQEQAARGVKLRDSWNRKESTYHQLYTETAKKIFEMIYISNPDDWHTKAKNRFTEGDYGK
ncbi:MAG: HD domain-containing protein [Candidatus Colwellbacteria bacterium]|nr:HD domain-containing protein [Candidatus Colwellbacteria bacterium]